MQKAVSARWEAPVSSVILVGLPVLYVYTYTLTYIHTSQYMNNGLQRKGREVDGAPPVERDERKNEWFQRNLTQSSQGFVITAL